MPGYWNSTGDCGCDVGACGADGCSVKVLYDCKIYYGGSS